jgi:hypothetical protein
MFLFWHDTQYVLVRDLGTGTIPVLIGTTSPTGGRLHIPYRLKQCFAYKNPVIGVNVVKAINHPPVITFFLIGGIFTSPKWVVYGIVLTTL